MCCVKRRNLSLSIAEWLQLKHDNTFYQLARISFYGTLYTIWSVMLSICKSELKLLHFSKIAFCLLHITLQEHYDKTFQGNETKQFSQNFLTKPEEISKWTWEINTNLPTIFKFVHNFIVRWGKCSESAKTCRPGSSTQCRPFTQTHAGFNSGNCAFSHLALIAH